MDRNIKSEVSRWIKSPDSKRFLEEFRKFEEENFEAGRIPKQKDIERFQEAKVPLVGEIRHPFGKVLQFPLRKRRFKVNAFLKKLFFDFPYIKFVPGIVHYQSERIYPDDYEALRFLKGSLRILKNLCLSAIGEGQIEEQRFLSSDLAGTFICTGGPVSNAISRIAMQYERKERDPTKGFLRTTEPIIQLRYEPVYDVEYVLSEAGYMVRFIDDKAHRAPNWFIRDIRSGELLKPAKHKKDDVDDVLATDFLLISILPNILDRESYERGDKIQIFGGTHGVGTRAVELVCSDSSLIERITGLVGKLPYWQVLLEINAIDHREGQSRPISLRNDIRWCEVTINEAKLDEWFGKDRLFGKSSRRSDVIKSGKESSTTETCSSEDQAESQGGGSKEFSSDHHQPKDTLSPLGSGWTEDSLGGGDTMIPQREKKNSYNPYHVSWRPSITSYSVQEKRALKFPSTEEIDRAISLCWNDQDLKDVPRAYAGSLTMVVPENSVELFRTKGLSFEVLRVLSQSDLPPERYESLKRKYGM